MFEHFVDRPMGRDRAHPLPEGALEAKFIDCAQEVQDGASAQALLAAFLDLEAIEDVRGVAAMMRAGLLPDTAPLPARASA